MSVVCKLRSSAYEIFQEHLVVWRADDLAKLADLMERLGNDLSVEPADE